MSVLNALIPFGKIVKSIYSSDVACRMQLFINLINQQQYMNSINDGQLSVGELILANCELAYRLTSNISRKWNFSLPLDEIRSIGHLALCEAASRFDSTRGTQFITFLYPFIQGLIRREIDTAMKLAQSRSICNKIEAMNAQDFSWQESTSPEKTAVLAQFRQKINSALIFLTNIERQTVIAINIYEEKISSFAQDIGYSRPHISEVNQRALGKLKSQLTVIQ